MVRQAKTQSDGGRVEVICGPMFSGKTTELIRRLGEARAEGRRVVAVKPAADVRSGTGRIMAHTGEVIEAVDVADSDGIVQAVMGGADGGGADVVGVEEVHFYGVAGAEACMRLARTGVRVIAAGVDFDEKGELFEAVARLLDAADDVTRLTARCTVCGGVARYTQRMVDDDARIVVGGAEAYEPRCERCFVPRE